MIKKLKLQRKLKDYAFASYRDTDKINDRDYSKKMLP